MTWLFCACVLLMASEVLCQIPDISNFFPDVGDDVSKITWGHAINEKETLENAINDPGIMMLECDVVRGTLTNGNANARQIPIMAHPPVTQSDQSLEQWIVRVIKANQEGKRKGAKIDFKDQNVITESMEMLAKYKSSIAFPLWFNADILSGPGAVRTPIDAGIFISICREFFPTATLSLGWTTEIDTNDPSQNFTMEMVQEMANVVEKNNVDQPVTFPVRAAFAGRSNDSIAYLLDMVPSSSVTIWSAETDVVDMQSLLAFQETISPEQIFFDLPKDQQMEFDEVRRAGVSGATPSVPIFPSRTAFWATVTTVAGALAALYLTGE